MTIRPRSAYLPNPQEFATVDAANDCVGAAEQAGVRVSGYFGINFQFSGPLSLRSSSPYDPLSLGGTYIRRSAAGAAELFGATWLSAEHVARY